MIFRAVIKLEYIHIAKSIQLAQVLIPAKSEPQNHRYTQAILFRKRLLKSDNLQYDMLVC